MANKFSETGSNVPEVLSSFLLIVFRSPTKIRLLSEVACYVTQLDKIIYKFSSMGNFIWCINTNECKIFILILQLIHIFLPHLSKCTSLTSISKRLEVSIDTPHLCEEVDKQWKLLPFHSFSNCVTILLVQYVSCKQINSVFCCYSQWKIVCRFLLPLRPLTFRVHTDSFKSCALAITHSPYS